MSTLLILLYAKTVHTVASVFTFTQIQNADRSFKVLSVDGNVRFGSPEHIPLLVVASFLALFLALFMFSLLFIQMLIKISSQRCFKWVARLRPFLDTIIGPCNYSYAFWPGYLLFIRTVYISCQPFLLAENSVIWTSMICCAIVTIIFSFLGPKGAYKKWSMNMLELSLMVNLFITSVTLLLVSPKYTTTISRVSVAFALLVFISYHLSIICICLKRLKEMAFSFIANLKAPLNPQRVIRNQESRPTVTEVAVSTSQSAEHTPLLTAQVMPPVINCSRLREPLLED